MKGRTTSPDQDDRSDHRWIVVADADEDAARALAAHLLQRRFRAYSTGRGSEALRAGEAHLLSLAVIDVALADMPGRELVRRLRAIEPALPIVMTTADFAAAIEIDARQLGIVQYVQKPFDFRRLELVARRVHATPCCLTGGVPGNDR